MGQGIDMVRQDSPLHAEVLDNFKDQLLIVLLKRLGPKVSISVEEMDDTCMDTVAFNVIDGVFNFEVRKKC